MEGIGEKSRIYDGFYASSIGCHNMILKPSTDVLCYTLKKQKPKSWNLIKSQEWGKFLMFRTNLDSKVTIYLHKERQGYFEVGSVKRTDS